MRIRVITFDWGDTLAANHGQPYNLIMEQAFDRLGKDLAAAGAAPGASWVADCLAELTAIWSRSFDEATNPDHREFDWWSLLAGWIRSTGADPDDPALAGTLARYGRSLTDTVIPYADALPTLRRLKTSGYRVGILSHVPWPGAFCRDWYRRWSLAPWVDFYSLSSEVGWIKPSPRHYAHALELADCPADAVLHVGDHPRRDVVGACEFGFRTCLRVTQGIYPDEDLAACGADLRVASVSELPELLGREG